MRGYLYQLVGRWVDAPPRDEHVVLVGLGSLFQKDYAYLPEEWKVEGGPANQHEIAARNCFITATIYGVFLGMSFMCCVNNKARGRTA